MSRMKRKMKSLRTKEEQTKGGLSHRRLTQSLIFSGALNIALATSLIYFAVKTKEPASPYSYSKAPESSLVLDLTRETSIQNVLEQYLNLDYDSLVKLLDHKEQIEEGVTQRDIALSILASSFDLDLNRALHGQCLQSENFTVDHNSDLSVTLYMNLKDAQYKQILSFLKTEQWPFTSEGLFHRIVEGQSDPSLIHAFKLSREFMLLEALFGPYNLPKEELLTIISQGPFELVKKFAASKPQVENFSNALRMHFLSQYLEYGSEKAAELILNFGPDYALKKLSDEKIVALLGLLENKTERSQNFALHLALGSRGDWVKQEACRLLYHYANREFPKSFNYKQALEIIAQEYALAPEGGLEALVPAPQLYADLEETPELDMSQMTTSLSSPKTYVVQKGDCLSKIAKKHDVNIRRLKEANHLDSDVIRVGMELLIP